MEVESRLPHGLGSYSPEAKALRELEKQKHIQDNQNEYKKIEIS